jgi:hypothetical protein
LQEAKDKFGAPKTYFKVSHPPKKFHSCVALMSSIINAKPSSYEEARVEHVWQDIMVEGYNSIMKNDVEEIVPRLEGKSVVDYVIHQSCTRMDFQRATKV